MQSAVIVGFLIVFSGLCWQSSRSAHQKESLENVKRFFGKAVLVKQKQSYWQKYLRNLSTDLNRIGIQVSEKVIQKWIVIFVLCFFVVTRLAQVPIFISLIMIALMTLLPRQIVREMSLRYLINFRKNLMMDVVQTGAQALANGTVEEVFEEIEQDALSKVIKKEFNLINQAGAAQGMSVTEAMVLRAEQLDINEFRTLAILTREGKRRNADLEGIWKAAGKTLWAKIKQQNALQSSASTFRMVAIGLFLALIGFVTFGYHAFHIHGAMQFGVLLTLVSYFVGITQVAKTSKVF